MDWEASGQGTGVTAGRKAGEGGAGVSTPRGLPASL